MREICFSKIYLFSSDVLPGLFLTLLILTIYSVFFLAIFQKKKITVEIFLDFTSEIGISNTGW